MNLRVTAEGEGAPAAGTLRWPFAIGILTLVVGLAVTSRALPDLAVSEYRAVTEVGSGAQVGEAYELATSRLRLSGTLAGIGGLAALFWRQRERQPAGVSVALVVVGVLGLLVGGFGWLRTL